MASLAFSFSLTLKPSSLSLVEDRTLQPNATRSNPAEKRLALERQFSLLSAFAQHVEVTILWWHRVPSRGSRSNFCPDRSWRVTCRLSWGTAIVPEKKT